MEIGDDRTDRDFTIHWAYFWYVFLVYFGTKLWRHPVRSYDGFRFIWGPKYHLGVIYRLLWQL